MSTSSSPPELKWNRFDALVALAVVLLAVAAALLFYLPRNQSGALTVVIDVSPFSEPAPTSHHPSPQQ